MTRSFFDNPDFLAYVRLLHRLHALIRLGQDESQEGESLRDALDAPGSRLSSDEIRCVSGISADFYTLEGPAVLPPTTPDSRADLQPALLARDRQEYAQAFDLLRQLAESVPPAVLAYVRGTIWQAAGEHTIATDFFARAAHLEPENTQYADAYLHSLRLSDLDHAPQEAG
jgi:hypothetical protein